MSDRLLYEPVGIADLARWEPASHARLAQTLGRVGDVRAVPLLTGFLRDSRVEVRRSAAFALGLLGDRQAAPALAVATADQDTETGRLAVEALTRLGEPLANWSGALGSLPAEEQALRLYPSLFRLTPEEVDRVVQADAGDLQPGVGRWLAYAAGRTGGPGNRELLRRHLDDPDPWVRGWAARGLGRLGDASDLGRLAPLLEDPSPTPVIQALRAANGLIETGRAAPPEEWISIVQGLLSDRRAGVRAAALDAVGAWLPQPSLERVLEGVLLSEKYRERERALLALARARTVEAEAAVLRASLSPRSSLRAVAATAAGALDIADVVEMLWSDSEPKVRLAALAARLERGGEERLIIARQALADSDPAVRAAALEWLEEWPDAPIEELLAAMRGPGARELPGLALNGVRAIAARHQEALERGAVIAALEELARDEKFLVRRAAADALEALGRPRPDIGWISADAGLDDYRGLVAMIEQERYVAMETARGTIVLQLACEEAPLTCTNFLQLVNQGFYDGLAFHRVVPDFVVQGGDPRGDGWGGPGYTIRDENNRIHFGRGVLGMAKSGRDDAGSQFFITLSEQPHLDGDYTAFGHVVDGDEVLDRIIQGDVVTTMKEVNAAGIDSGR